MSSRSVRVKELLPFQSLEPCGTMTTITRLDCGCIQETTRPIFTTSKGRVLKKGCNHSQNQVLLNVEGPNIQEHLHASFDARKARFNTGKARRRCSLPSSNYRENCVDFADDFEIVNQQRSAARKPAMPQGLQRSSRVLPVRRYSETSIVN